MSNSYKADKQKCNELLNTIEKKLATIRQRREEVEDIRMKTNEYRSSKEDIAKELEELETLLEKVNDPEYLASDSYKADKQKCNELLNTIEKKLATIRQRREEIEQIRQRLESYRPFEKDLREELEKLEEIMSDIERKANESQYLVSDAFNEDKNKFYKLAKTIDRKISLNIQRIFDSQCSQLERLCENTIISRDILDEYEQAIRESNIQKAATVNESVKKIIDNLCSYKHWPKLLDEITTDSSKEFYAVNSNISENLNHLKDIFEIFKNSKFEELGFFSETLNNEIQTFSSENIHDAIRNIFIENLKNSKIDTDEYIIGKIIDKISGTTDQLEFLCKCIYNISHIEPLKKLSEIAKFIDDSLIKIDEMRAKDKYFDIKGNQDQRESINTDFGKRAVDLYKMLSPEDKEILMACTLKSAKSETFLVFLSSICDVKNTSKLHIRYLCKKSEFAIDFEKSKSKLREKFSIFKKLNESALYKHAVIVPVLFETAINRFGVSRKI